MSQDRDRDCLLQDNDAMPSTSSDYDQIESHPVESPGPRETDRPAKIPQIRAAFAATLCALSAGLVLGWTSPIFSFLTQGKYNNIPINKSEMGWIGSFATLGAMAMCIPTGFLCDLIGRRTALLLLTIPFLAGWALIIWAKGIIALYFGRLITGMAVGGSCVAAPLYNGEIAHQSFRGALGSLYQLMIVTGIFLAYVFGEFLGPYTFTKFCACIPFVFLAMFSFQPETPHYLIKKGEFEQAKKSLAQLRGPNYDVDAELAHIEGCLKETSLVVSSIKETLMEKPVIKAVIITFALMFFQQFSGINVIILYSSDIFTSSGIHLNSNIATIFVGAVQALANLCASLVIEKLGRKLLLYISLSAIAINTALLAIYFSLKTRGHPDSEVLKDIGFIPVAAVCLFVLAFSLGIGPIPWMIASEILPTQIRSMVGSAAGTLNWFLAFVITKTYLDLSDIVGNDTMFYIFSALSISGTIFVLMMLPETKGKSITEIQEELSQ